MHFNDNIMNFGHSQKHLAGIKLPGVMFRGLFGPATKQTMKKGAILLTTSMINSYSYSELIINSAEYAMNIFYFIVLNPGAVLKNRTSQL